MGKRRISKITATLIIASFALAANVANADRLEHARELLGRHYDRAIASSVGKTHEVRLFVNRITRDSLNKHWKRQAPRIARAILEESKRYGFDPIFVISVIQTESSFSPTARGTSGEIGLMQLMPETGKWLASELKIRWRGKRTLLDPVQNIRLGAAYLSRLRQQFDKDGRLYIPAYNMGASAVRDAVAEKVFPAVYAKRVMRNYLENYDRISGSVRLGEEIRNERLLRRALRREHQRVRRLERSLSAQQVRQVAFGRDES